MRGALRLACGLAVALAMAPAAGAESERSALAERLDAALGAAPLRGARLGALVVQRADGGVLYQLAPGRPLVPASNQKVLTALAALDAFGPTHRFVTRVHADAPPDPRGAVGTLYVRGGGDPALNSEDWWRLAADLRRAGLRRVRGDLVLDDSLFDRERWNPAWGPVGARAYHAPVGALVANYGAFAVEVRPAASREQGVAVSLDPPIPWFQLVNRAATGAPGQRRSLLVERAARPGGERVTVSGTAPAGGDPKVFYRSVTEPAAYAGGVLRWQLEANGIPVEGELRLGPTPATAPELLAFPGRPLAEIVRLFLKYSNNMVAEALVKGLGAHEAGEPGTWANGMTALRARLEGLGLDLSQATLVDGSGLARENRLTPRLLVETLRLGADSFGFGPELVAALPIAAGDGTLERRAAEAAGVVRAKTGLLDGVTALSGYARTQQGREVVFSVLVNGYRGSDEQAMRSMDEFLRVLVTSDPLGPGGRAARRAD